MTAVSTEPIELRADPPETLDLPSAHLDLRWRHLRPEDAGALGGLAGRIEAADDAHGFSGAQEVIAGSWKHLEADTLGGFDDEGTLRAFASVDLGPGSRRTLQAFLLGGVDPKWRGNGIGRALLAWMEGRGRRKLVESGKQLPARLAVRVGTDTKDARRLYAAGGFSPVRWYSILRRGLRDPIPEPALPDGVRVVRLSPDLDDRARIAHNEVFADHWGSEPRTAQEWTERGGPIARRWSIVALDTHDEIVGYAVSRGDANGGEAGSAGGNGGGARTAHTDLLGVTRAWRGKGVAAALLTRALNAYRADGVVHATLDADADNPSGAYGWYRRLGYTPVRNEILYSIEL